MRTIKKLALGSLLMVILLTTSGCVLFKEVDAKAEMLQYMEDKYGEAFTFVEPAGGVLGGSGRGRAAGFFSNERFPDELIFVARFVDSTTREVTFMDDYVAYLHKADTQAVIDQVVEEAFGSRAQGRFLHISTVLPEEWDATTTLEEFLCRDGRPISIRILVDGSVSYDEEADVQALDMALQSHGVYGYIYITYVADAPTMMQIDDEEFVNDLIARRQYRLSGVIAMSIDPLEIDDVDLKKGEPGITPAPTTEERRSTEE